MKNFDDGFEATIDERLGEKKDNSLVSSFAKKELEINGQIYPYLILTTIDGKSYYCGGDTLYFLIKSHKLALSFNLLKLSSVAHCDYDDEIRLIVCDDRAVLHGNEEFVKKTSKSIY